MECIVIDGTVFGRVSTRLVIFEIERGHADEEENGRRRKTPTYRSRQGALIEPAAILDYVIVRVM